MYINVGARDKTTYKDIPTKTALKRAVRDFPSNTVLYNTSGFDGQGSRSCTELQIGVKYSVTGPNPYTSRKWYATVEKHPDGHITVK